MKVHTMPKEFLQCPYMSRSEVVFSASCPWGMFWLFHQVDVFMAVIEAVPLILGDTCRWKHAFITEVFFSGVATVGNVSCF